MVHSDDVHVYGLSLRRFTTTWKNTAEKNKHWMSKNHFDKIIGSISSYQKDYASRCLMMRARILRLS